MTGPRTESSNAATIGTLLCRVVVPLWILLGAGFKLYERTPSNLPSLFVQAGKDWGIDLGLMLRTLIGLEFLAIAIMIFVPKYARAMAIFMLSCFCLILIAELVRQSTSCGCFGSVKIHPGVMLAIDGALLLGVILFKPGRSAGIGTWAPVAALATAAAGFTMAYVIPDKVIEEAPVVGNGGDNTGNGQTPDNGDPSTAVNPDGTINNPAPEALPGFYYVASTDAWVGKSWREVDLVRLMRTWPAGLDEGRTHLIFYRRSCDHCEEMFNRDLTQDLEDRVVAIEVPESASALSGDSVWTMPETNCEMMQLPIGTDWVITPPLIITIEDGTVACAEEGTHHNCMGLPPLPED